MERPDPLAPPEGYGRKPGWQPEPVISATCTHNNGACGEPSEILVKLGCIGEHIAELTFCAPHWARVSLKVPAWQCRGPENRGCGNPMNVELVRMLTEDAARRVALEMVQMETANQSAIDGAVTWAAYARTGAWYRPVQGSYEEPADRADPQTGLERVREAVRKARGGDAPAAPQGYA